MEYAKFQLEYFDKYFKGVKAEDYEKANRRQLKQLQNIGTSILSEEDLDEFNTAVGEMTRIYSAATICPKDNPTCNGDEGLALDPGRFRVLCDV